MLEETLKTTRRETRCSCPAVFAYADDVTVIMRSRDNIQHIKESLRCYEAASGTKLNVQKSKAVALVVWDTSEK
jgi:hypothetical protein